MRALAIAAGIAGLVVLQAGPAAAQGTDARITVPFAFTAHGQSFPAGAYDVRMSSDDPSVMWMDNVSQPSHDVAMLTIPEHQIGMVENQPSLDFTKRNGVEQLSDFVDSLGEGHQVIEHARR